MEVVPAERAVARPEESMVATVVSELTQVAVEVKSAVLESLKVPVAVNCWVCPSSIETLVGVTAMEVKVGGGVVTCRLAEPLVIPSWEAVMSVVPAERAVARPEESMVAMAVSELTQVAVEVKSAVLESLKVPVAVNC